MEHSLFLRQYKFEIPRSATAVAGVSTKIKSTKDIQEPALRVLFDFENGCFLLEGDCGLIVSTNTRHKNSWLNGKNARVFIDANMKPEIPDGPDDNLNMELLLCLKGHIQNGDRQFKCSGILRLNRHSNDSQWMIYCNLVDNDMHFFEIRLNLPVFTTIIQSPGDN